MIDEISWDSNVKSLWLFWPISTTIFFIFISLFCLFFFFFERGEEIDIRTENSTSVFVDERTEFRCFSYRPKILQLGKQDNFRGIFIDVQAFSLLSASRDRDFYWLSSFSILSKFKLEGDQLLTKMLAGNEEISFTSFLYTERFFSPRAEIKLLERDFFSLFKSKTRISTLFLKKLNIAHHKLFLIYSIVKQSFFWVSQKKILSENNRTISISLSHPYTYIHTHVILFYSSFEQTFLSPGSIETNSRGHRKCINTGRRSASCNFGMDKGSRPRRRGRENSFPRWKTRKEARITAKSARDTEFLVTRVQLRWKSFVKRT